MTKRAEPGKPPSRAGLKNLYLCDTCGHGFVSVDVDDGVTPFATACENSDGDDRGNPCKGMATSFFYMCPQNMLARATPAIEWYRPSQAELDVEGAYTPGERDHVAKGGLLSRPNRSAIMARVRAEAAEAEAAMTPEDKARHAELLASIESRKTQAPYGGKVPGSGKVPSDTAS